MARIAGGISDTAVTSADHADCAPRMIIMSSSFSAGTNFGRSLPFNLPAAKP